MSLERTGPDPWDFRYTPERGERVSFIDGAGKTLTGVVIDCCEEPETGGHRITIGSPPLGDMQISSCVVGHTSTSGLDKSPGGRDAL